eukprot:TRINITY_DN7255_c0_g1_i5.p1 TRINITY_DN7255_c0_g1~~TRINITY_DN7255_c0_g1_i5.p1  ORF type:complete len:771 (-),score=194.80 TRINITY_DN7255_c0_g1_i5:178-2490(-)
MLRSLFSAVVETVTSVVRTNKEQLKWTWQKFNQEYSRILTSKDDAVDDPHVVDASTLPDLLASMVQLLLEEEADVQSQNPNTPASTPSNFGPHPPPIELPANLQNTPCLEYFLDERILDKLCAIGLSDRPPGLRRLVGKTLDGLLVHLAAEILANMAVHTAVSQFLCISFSQGDLQHRKNRPVLVSLLRTLCRRIRHNPSLAEAFFVQHPHYPKRPAELIVFTSLLPLMNVDGEDGDKAREGLLWCVQLPIERVSLFILDQTLFCEQLVYGIKERYEKLPRLLPDSESYAAAVSTFLPWLQILNVVAQSSFKFLAERVVGEFLNDFLRETLVLHLLQPATALSATHYLRHMLTFSTAPLLQQAFIDFLLHTVWQDDEKAKPSDSGNDTASGSDANDSSAGGNDSANHSVSMSSVLMVLVARIKADVATATATLGLFQALIDTLQVEVLWSLALQPLATGRHLKPAQRAQHLARSQLYHIRVSDIMSKFPAMRHIAQFAQLEDYLLDAQDQAQVWLQRWQDVVLPIEGASTPADGSVEEKTDGPSSEPNSTPTSPDNQPPTQTDSSSQQPEEGEVASQASQGCDAKEQESEGDHFEGGAFLQLLFHRLGHLHHQPFALNLALTSVLAHLAHCPHPLLHAFLLDPNLPTLPHTPHLLALLQQVYEAGMKSAASMPDYVSRLQAARAALNQGSSVLPPANLTPHPTPASGSGSDDIEWVEQAGQSDEPVDVNNFLHGQIVLEEFLKELLAIAQAKSTLHSLSSVPIAPAPTSP